MSEHSIWVIFAVVFVAPQFIYGWWQTAQYTKYLDLIGGHPYFDS